MHATFLRRIKRTLLPGLGITTMLLLGLCLHIGAVPHAFASGGGPMTGSATVALRHSPMGTASLSLDTATKVLTVQIDLVGLAPNSTHPAHIHLESCKGTGPEIIKYPLATVIADANGKGTSTTTLHDIPAIPATGWSIKVHNGPEMATEAESTIIACAPITNPDESTSVRAAFGSTSSPNENASGTARLTISQNVLTVWLDVYGLAPNSVHAAHIHAGDCANSGKVLYNMTPLVADASGHATKVSTFSGVTSIPATGWDINIHYSTDLSTQTGYNPILCGNVVPD